MNSLGFAARTLKHMFLRRSATVRRQPRRLNQKQRNARAIIEALEQRQLLTATHLAFDLQPTTTVAGNSISTITVDVLDGSNAIATSSSALVTFTIATGPAGESLSFAVPANHGVATLDGLSFTTAGGYTLRASATSLTAALSSSFTISPDTADHLAITSGPVSTNAGQTISSVAVEVRDQFDNVVTSNSSSVIIALASGSGTLLGTTTVAASSGVATFSDLSLHSVGTYTLSVSDSGLLGGTSSSFTISPAAASKLVITQQPASTTAGLTISTVNVSVEDAYDNVVTNSTASITVSLNSGTGSLAGTKTVSAVNGVATFSTLSLNQADAFTLHAAGGGVTAANSSSFTVSPATATQVVFTNQPGNVSAGALGSVVVSVEDQYGNVVTSNSSSITVAIGTGSGTLNGTKTMAASSGVATFGNLSLTKADGYTLVATDSGLTGATSSSFTVAPGAATQLVITQGPTNTVAGQSISTVLVAVEDQYGNLVSNDTSSITIAIASGTGSLLGTATAAASGGVATFSGLSIQHAGGFTLAVTDGSLSSATSSSFTIAPAAASMLAFTQQPGSVAAGALGTVKVSVEDQYGNVITTDSSTVTLSLASGSGSLLGTLSAAAVNGVATFGSLAIHTADGYTLAANAGTLTQGVSNSFTISPTTANHLAFTAQPSSMVAGNLLTGITAAVEDQYNNVVTSSSANITFRLTGGGNTSTFVVQASGGVASLAGVYLVTAGDYSVRATSTGLTLANSNNITVTPDVPHQLIITQDTSSAVAGHTLSTILVQVQDQFGNLVTNDTSSVSIAIASGSGTLLGTTTVGASGGVATFSDLSIRQANDFTLTVSDSSLVTATTGSFTISPDAAVKLVITTQPADNTAGVTLAGVVAKVEDQYGNIITTDSSAVTIAIASGTGTLLGTKTVNASSGVAAFSTLSIQKTGGFTLAVTDGSLTSATSSSFSISAAAADHLDITGQPSSGQAGNLNTVTVAVEDQYNNVVINDASSVTIAIASGSGSLLGTKTVNASSGVATFSTLSIHTPDAYTLSVADGSLTAATSSSFTITPAAADHLTLTQDTANATAGGTLSTILVEVRDQYGNLVTNNTSSVTIAIASGTGTLLGTKTVSASAGVATFSTLSIRKTGSFTLSLTDGSLTAATTASFTITPDAATHLAITQDTTSATAGHTLSTILVAVEDQYGNVVTTDSSVVTITPSDSFLFGNDTASAVSGIATFSGLSMTYAGDYTLSVSDSGLAGATGASFNIAPDAPDHLAYLSLPSATTAGSTLDPFVVAVVDQYDNVVTYDNSDISIAINSTTGTLLGTTTLTADQGMVEFDDLSIRKTGTFALIVSDGSLDTNTTGNFAISAAAANHLTITAQPASLTAGQTISTLTVEVRDQYENVVANNTSSVTIAIASGSGTLLGTKTVSATSGIASFSTLSLQQAGNFTLGVTDGGMTSATSSSFTVSAAAADHLAITSQPASGQAGSLNTVTVAVEDQYNNVVTNDTSSVTIAVATGSGSLLGTKTVTAASGIATFSTLAIHTPDTYALSVTDASLTAATSSSFTITPAAASQLVITQQPTTTVAGQSISDIIVTVEDQFGNVVTSNSSNITIAMSGGNITLGGTKTVAASSGVATFSGLSINTTGSYTLAVTDGSLTSATTSSFSITPAAASQLAITTGPATTVAGQTLSSIVAKVEDQYGNVVTSDSSNVTIALFGSGATLSGTKTVAASSGVATFSTLSMNQAGSYTLRVTDGGLTAANSGSFILSPDTASQLVITQDAANGTAGSTLSSIVVAVEDQYGNVVTSNSSTVSIAIASGTGSLFGTQSVAAVSGIATFGALNLHKTGNFTLALTDGSLASATTSSFTVTPAAASQLVFTAQPTNAVAGSLLSTVAVAVEDQYGNIITSNSSNISLSINSNGVTLNLIVPASSGVASFSGVAITKTGDYTFRASGAGQTAVNSSTFTISPDVADHLAITQQPASGTAGGLSSVLVAVEDQYNNVVTNNTSSVTIALASGPDSLGGTKTVAASSGVATFSSLSLTTAGSYTLAVTDGSLTSETSSSFTITPAAASQLVITQQTANAVAGQTLSSFQVSVEDQYGNVVTSNTSTVAVALGSGTGTLLGTQSAAAVNGVATFSGLSIRKTGSFTLAVTDGSLTSATGSSFTITPDIAAQLVVTTQPTTTVAGSSISAIAVSVEDQYGNVVTTDSSSVTLALNSGVTLSGTKTVNASSGVATFSGLSINTTGSYTVAATDASLTSATSSSFTITPAAADHLTITQQPASGTVGGLSSILVQVRDQYNNLVTTNSSAVTIAIASGPGSLGGTTTVNAASGIATFSAASIHTAGSYTLSVTDGGLTSATSSSFTLAAGAAAQLAITQQPASTTAGTLGTITATVQDQYGNTVTSNGSSVTLAIASGTGTLGGTTTVAASSGVATFTGNTLTKSGSFTLAVTDGALTSATSSSFTISPTAATQVVFTGQPAGTAAGTLGTITASIEDQYGNVVTSDSSSVTIALASGTATLGGTKTVSASSGVATFTGLTLTMTGGYTLAVTDGSLSSATSNSFTVTPAAASQLVLTQDAASAVAGHTLSNIVAAVEDQYGNLVTTDASSVTIAINTGTGTLLGTKTISASSGVATFSTLSIQKAGAFTLRLTDGSLTAATTSSFTISPDAASKLAFTASPANATAGTALSTFTVAVEDQYGNVATTNTSTVSLALSADIAVNGTTSAAAVNGIATFTGISLNKSGNYTFSASGASLTGATSSSFAISSAAATHVVLTQTPESGQVGGLGTITALVEDAYDNVVTTDASQVSIALNTDIAVLLGTTSVTAENGVATFSNLAIHTPGSFALRASDGGLSSYTTGEFTLTPGAANHLAFIQGPASGQAGQTNTLIVAIEDQYNNIVTSDESTVTLSLSPDADVTGTPVATAVNGFATFSDLAVNTAGSYVVTAHDGELTTASSDSFTVSPAAAAQLVITQDTESDVAGNTLSTIIVKVEDQFGNLVTTNSSSITLAVHSGPGTVAGTLSVNAEGGVASFSDLSITTAGDYTLSVTDGDLTAATTDSFTISPDEASQLVITQDTGNSTAGHTLSTVVVAVEDQFGNVVTDDTSEVTIGVDTGSGTLGGTTTVNAVHGIATFSNLSLTAADTYALTVTDDALDTATTDNFDISPAAASKLVITAQPATQAARLLPVITAEIHDQYDNLITNNSSNVSLSVATGSGSLSGTTTVAAHNGIATFTGVSLSKNGAFTLRVADGSLTTDTTDSFTVGAKLVFQRQPASTTAGTVLGPLFNVLLVDANGHVITSVNSAVTITVSSGPGTLNGTVTVNAINGVASFTDLNITTAGSYKLTASADSMTPTTSAAFTIKPTVTTQMVILQDVSDAVAGSKIGPAVRIKLLDAYGNVAVNDHSKITMTIADGPDGGALSGTVSATATNGIVTFSNLVLKQTGSYTLQASEGDLSIETDSLNVTAAAAKKLVISTLPTTIAANTTLADVLVTVTDNFGNIVTSGAGSTASVTLAFQSAPSGSGTLHVVSAASSGQAVFSGLSFSRLGKYKLRATATGLTAVTSSQLTVTPNLAAGH